tara:strand:- start:55 stop:375 length:321 start_codon:yes stop_codon:yes gene_type:complete
MEKFISIPTGAGPNQLVSVNDLVGVFAGTAATNNVNSVAAANTVLTYVSGKTVTLLHTSQSNFAVRDAIQTAIVEALKTSWTKPVGYVIPSLPVTLTGLTVSATLV